MRYQRFLRTSATVVMFCLATYLPAQEKPAGEQPGGQEIDMAAMMKKWQEVATPGEPHKVLEACVGSWKTHSKMWMTGPDGPATESEGTSEVRWIMGKRFLQEQSSGTFMNMPYQGFGITGYDNFKKKYTSFYIDNMNTASYTSEGTIDPAGKVITFFGQMDEWMTGEHDRVAKYVLNISGPDRHVFQIFDLSSGDNAKMMEITYTRQKKE